MTETAGLRRLLTPEGQALLNSLPPYDPATALRLNKELRTTHDPELVAAALTQQHLRQRAESKLGEFARTLLFTEAGLQQATRLQVAAQHARRYRDAGVTHVADLGCGLGIDSLALAALGL
ncbi:MAG: SAM-dependent methyltransferase, partial [bacterium]|nr:SAM-dependent methyltransferase [bacterium]